MSVGITAAISTIVQTTVVCLVFLAERIESCAPQLGDMIARSKESERGKLKRKVGTMLVLFAFVWLLVPYQFAFVVSFMVHLASCVRSLTGMRKAQKVIIGSVYPHLLFSFFFFYLPP